MKYDQRQRIKNTISTFLRPLGIGSPLQNGTSTLLMIVGTSIWKENDENINFKMDC